MPHVNLLLPLLPHLPPNLPRSYGAGPAFTPGGSTTAAAGAERKDTRNAESYELVPWTLIGRDTVGCAASGAAWGRGRRPWAIRGEAEWGDGRALCLEI
jgi:hypothetical protein